MILQYTCAILAGLGLGAITAALMTFLAGVFPIRERPCSVSDYHLKD
jgi:hypothetical protein